MTTTTYVGSLMSRHAEIYRNLMQRPSLYEVVLRHGKEMQPERLTMEQARYIATLAKRVEVGGVNAFQLGQCYYNSQRLITHDTTESPRLQYCEGYVAWDNGFMPVDHAWLVLDGSKVVDLTLRAKSKAERHSYCGMTIPRKLVMKQMHETRKYRPLLEGPYQNELFPEETAKWQSAEIASA